MTLTSCNTVSNKFLRTGLGGFGAADLAVEVFIEEADFEKANPVIEDFYTSIKTLIIRKNNAL
ncbi:hypothetical protein NLG42_21790 [Flavobacterium plurextorum]|uniref:hypothetical protein n=1 Tax=Flavobacterium TaxID=237 RepID=UPI00214D16D8|nr:MULTISPECIES: hypothetical protein [Flavobacterium]UUW08724.1 hypothetical protein NLG42_21790 [Flavobacterium plurextorum]